jgi:hypothetical protein
MFYCFSQNNSGGHFSGPAQYVLIEATTASDANEMAEEFGLYFDGVAAGRDCECCGSRWYRASRDDGSAAPAIYGETDLTGFDHVIVSRAESGKLGIF